MPTTKVIKPKQVDAPGQTVERSKPVKARAVDAVPAVRKSRASSCPRCPQRDKCAGSTGAQRAAFSRERRARSSSTAPKTAANCPRRNAACPNAPVKHDAARQRCREASACPGPAEQRGVKAESKHASQSHKAFTVIPPNPKKRREIQRKAEAELAALEELRLSRAMAYVSINPSSVGGCMSLEEVRSKQQQEMMQAKRKQKTVKVQLVEQTHVLKS